MGREGLVAGLEPVRQPFGIVEGDGPVETGPDDESGYVREPALVDAYEDPINTWMDQSIILKTETWPAQQNEPGYLCYFCGPAVYDPNEPPATGKQKLSRTYAMPLALVASRSR